MRHPSDTNFRGQPQHCFNPREFSRRFCWFALWPRPQRCGTWQRSRQSQRPSSCKLSPFLGCRSRGRTGGSQKRSYLPKDYHARGAYAADARQQARQQALWNAATDGGSSAFFHPKPKPSSGVPLKGAYRGYDANSQVSYLPKDYHAPGASYSAARTTELWDAKANITSPPARNLVLPPPPPLALVALKMLHVTTSQIFTRLEFERKMIS